MTEQSPQSSYGMAAEFDSPEAVVAAAAAAHSAGYRQTDAFTPFPVDGLPEALGSNRTQIPLIVGISGLIGALAGFAMLWYANVVSYRWNVGGRPPNSWEAWIPITFEMGVLFAALSAVIGMLALNRLPMPYHPAFNIPNFSLASRHRFFLLIESADPLFEPERTRQFMNGLAALAVTEVPR